MDVLISAFSALTCVYLIWRMMRPRDVIDLQMGVIGLFSVGYYCVPIWFKQFSPLGDLEVLDIATAALIHWLFLIAVIAGTEIARKIVPEGVAIKTDQIDELVRRFRCVLVVLSFTIYLYYYFNYDITSYSSANFELYFADRGPLDAIVAMIANLGLAFIAYSVADAWRRRSFELVAYACMLAACVLLMLLVGQRLALLTPVIMLLASLAITGQGRRAIGLLGISVVALLFVSPVAVFVRESLADRQGQNAQTVLGSFSYGDDAMARIFQSIVDRGDLIYVTARMKPYVDAEPKPGLTYYGSVLVSPLPKVMYPGVKPYLLSTNGLPAGELSIKSWRTLVGGTGSLSAFGGIVAYREASWPGILLNGLATGLFFVLMGRWLGRGGLVGGVFYGSLFVVLTVKKVPPSFFEALAELMGMLPFIIAVVIANWGLSRLTRRKRPEPLGRGQLGTRVNGDARSGGSPSAPLAARRQVGG